MAFCAICQDIIGQYEKNFVIFLAIKNALRLLETR